VGVRPLGEEDRVTTSLPEIAARRRRERRAGALLVALLVVVLATLGVVQADFDPALYAPPLPSVVAGPGGAPDALADLASPGFEPAAPAESFDPATLYEKIDGKADLYLSAGFEGLTCRRFAAADPPGLGFEACVYRLKDADSAFAVFSRQRRPGPAVEGLGASSVATSNALFVAHGAAYLEVVSADEGERTRAGRLAFARAWRAAEGGGPAKEVRAPFPAEGRVDGSERLLQDSVFGLARLDNVLTAEYDQGGDLATAFWSERRSADEARALADAFVAHLEAGGATRKATLVQGAVTLDALGSLEVVCVRGRHLLGVHQADTEALARRLAEALCVPAAGEGGE